MTFSSIPGLEDVKKQLTASVQSNHIAHALLFAGKPGALSFPLALAFAQYLHCTNKMKPMLVALVQLVAKFEVHSP